jgi:hypothetical protein
MATDAPNANSPRSLEDVLYRDIQPLDAKRYAKLGLTRSDAPFGFASRQHFVPLQAAEFAAASIEYPIIFVGPERAPMAVMGIRTGENLFIGADGGFRTGAYRPAFLRRYPFAAALNEPANRLVIFIDRACELFTEDNPDVPLFDNGQPSSFTQTCIDFCRRYEADARATLAFVKRLADLDLFALRGVSHTPTPTDGSVAAPVPVAEFFAVSEARVKALSPQVLGELRDDGTLEWIYAHLLSMLVWQRLINESVIRAAASGAPTA